MSNNNTAFELEMASLNIMDYNYGSSYLKPQLKKKVI